MMQLEISPAQREALRWLVDRALPGLRFEAARTEDHDFKAFLSHQITALEGLAASLEQVQPETSLPH